MQRTTREEAEEEGLGHGSAPAADEARVRVYSTCKPIGLLAWTQLDSLALLVAISLYGLKYLPLSSAAAHDFLHLTWTGYTLAALLALHIVVKCFLYRRESLLVIHGIGFQISSEIIFGRPQAAENVIRGTGPTGRSYVTQRTTAFLPLSRTLDVLLLEGIVGWQVIWYLAIVVRDDDKGVRLLIPFRETRPRLEFLKQVWHHTRRDVFVQ